MGLRTPPCHQMTVTTTGFAHNHPAKEKKISCKPLSPSRTESRTSFVPATKLGQILAARWKTQYSYKLKKFVLLCSNNMVRMYVYMYAHSIAYLHKIDRLHSSYHVAPDHRQ